MKSRKPVADSTRVRIAISSVIEKRPGQVSATASSASRLHSLPAHLGHHLGLLDDQLGSGREIGTPLQGVTPERRNWAVSGMSVRHGHGGGSDLGSE